MKTCMDRCGQHLRRGRTEREAPKTMKVADPQERTVLSRGAMKLCLVVRLAKPDRTSFPVRQKCCLFTI